MNSIFNNYSLFLRIYVIIGIIAIIFISIQNLLAPIEIERGKNIRVYPAPPRIRVWEKSKFPTEFKGGLAEPSPHVSVSSHGQFPGQTKDRNEISNTHDDREIISGKKDENFPYQNDRNEISNTHDDKEMISGKKDENFPC